MRIAAEVCWRRERDIKGGSNLGWFRNKMASFNDIATHIYTYRLLTIVTFVGGVWSMFHHVVNHQDRFETTHFSANKNMVKAYLVFQSYLQFVFLFQFWSKFESVTETAKDVGYVYVLYHILQGVWAYFFGQFEDRSKYIISWLILVLNGINVFYFHHRKATYSIRPISRYWFIHVPVMAMPRAWLFYAFFWNGSLALKWDANHMNVANQVLSNVLLWAFLLEPAFVLIRHRDWAYAFAMSFWTWAISYPQQLHDGINYTLQTWFSVAISMALYFAAFFVAYPDSEDTHVTRADATLGEDAPLLNS